jgi:tripartite-type tricarboxylate transporter receptor subunit TctC
VSSRGPCLIYNFRPRFLRANPPEGFDLHRSPSGLCAVAFTLSLVLAAFAEGAALAAAAYPDRPLHLLVPYPAGGPNDVVARLIADKLPHTLGQQVVVENRAGGNGDIAVIETARAIPDGYTLVLPGIPYAVNPSLYTHVGYSFDQLAPISIVSTGPLVLVVHPSLVVKSVQELIAAAKAQPGRINYGSGAKGTSLHLAAELFKHAANVDLQQIPYVGTNALIPDMLTGRVPVVFISPLIAKQHVAQGSVLALGVTSATRSPAWPDTPTIAEAGLPGYSFETWYAVLAPRGTPKAIIDKLSVAIAEAVKSAEASEKLRSLGNVPVGSTPADAASYIETEAMRWDEIIRAAGIARE